MLLYTVHRIPTLKEVVTCYSIRGKILSSIVIYPMSLRRCHICWIGDPEIGSRGIMTRGPNITFEERDRSQVRPRDVMSGLTVPNMTYDYLVISLKGSYSINFTRQAVS